MFSPNVHEGTLQKKSSHELSLSILVENKHNHNNMLITHFTQNKAWKNYNIFAREISRQLELNLVEIFPLWIVPVVG